MSSSEQPPTSSRRLTLVPPPAWPLRDPVDSLLLAVVAATLVLYALIVAAIVAGFVYL